MGYDPATEIPEPDTLSQREQKQLVSRLQAEIKRLDKALGDIATCKVGTTADEMWVLAIAACFRVEHKLKKWPDDYNLPG